MSTCFAHYSDMFARIYSHPSPFLLEVTQTKANFLPIILRSSFCAEISLLISPSLSLCQSQVFHVCMLKSLPSSTRLTFKGSHLIHVLLQNLSFDYYYLEHSKWSRKEMRLRHRFHVNVKGINARQNVNGNSNFRFCVCTLKWRMKLENKYLIWDSLHAFKMSLRMSWPKCFEPHLMPKISPRWLNL